MRWEIIMRLVNDEFERIWKEVVVAYFKVHSHHAPGGAQKDYRNCVQNRLCPEW
jgi:hypothetical protein